MWGEPPEQQTLVDKNVLIMGLGHIGKAIAARAKAFGTVVIGVTRSPSRQLDVTDRLVGFVRFP